MEDEQRTIQEIGIEDVISPDRLAEIQAGADDICWTDDWSVEFYWALVRAGFISTCFEIGEGRCVLLPEIQKAYAVLDWGHLHVSRSMRRWLKSEECHGAGYELRVGHDLSAVVTGICRFHGATSWLTGHYQRLLVELLAGGGQGFELMPVGLIDREGRLHAGEIGYRCGRTYTSLSGFFDRSRTNVGKLQLLRLGEYLRDGGYVFWNLGHPYFQYKIDLGARILERPEFLRRWREGIGGSLPASSKRGNGA